MHPYRSYGIEHFPEMTRLEDERAVVFVLLSRLRLHVEQVHSGTAFRGQPALRRGALGGSVRSLSTKADRLQLS